MSETTKVKKGDSSDVAVPGNQESWGKAFENAAPSESEMLIDDRLQNEFDEKEWTW